MGVSRGETETALADRLRRLKRDGCVLLVTGDVNARTRMEATRRLLGDPLQTRTRVLALTESGQDAVRNRLPAGVTPDDPTVRVVDCRGERARATRVPDDAAAASDATTGDARSDESDGTTAGDSAETWKDGPSGPCEQVLRELAAVDHAGLTEGELRVCLDSLGSAPPFDAPDAPQTVRFLRLLTAVVRGVRGLGHVHCPIPDDDARVVAIDPLFDARIELRRRESLGPEQRWHLPEHGTTGWVRI